MFVLRFVVEYVGLAGLPLELVVWLVLRVLGGCCF